MSEASARVRRAHAFAQRLQVALQNRERCAQLVRDVGRPALARRLIARERAGGAIEILRKRADFVATPN